MSVNEILLKGLVGSTSIGAMAAFGLLRVCSFTPGLESVKLRWKKEHDWIAEIIVKDFDEDRLLEYLTTTLVNNNSPVLSLFKEDIRVSPVEYSDILNKQLNMAKSMDRQVVDYLSAFGSDGIVDKSKGLIKPTRFYNVSGNQKFLKIIRQIYESLIKMNKETRKEKIKEALFGPWKYEDLQHSLGWDPITERQYAKRYKNPTDDKPISVMTATWMAYMSLPLFQTISYHGRLRTAAFDSKSKQFIWPVWHPPIGFDTLRSLIVSSELMDKNKMHLRGVKAVYSSTRVEIAKGYGVFKPSILIWM